MIDKMDLGAQASFALNVQCWSMFRTAYGEATVYPDIWLFVRTQFPFPAANYLPGLG